MDNIKCVKYQALDDIIKNYQKDPMFKDAIIITASKNISRAMQEALGCDTSKIISISEILKELVGEWPNQGIVYDQIRLSEIIDEERHHLDENEYNFLKKSNRDILNAMKTACELGIKASMINTKDINEKHFVNIYKKFYDNSPNIKALTAKIASWQDTKFFYKLLEAVGLDMRRVKAIYLQGFFYVQPLQQRFIEALKNLPIQLYFLNNYDEKHKNVYEIWDNLYVENNKEAKYVPCQKNREYCCDEIFVDDRNAVASYKKPNIKITEFNDVFSFVRYVGKSKKDNIEVISPRSKEVQDIFEIYFPDKEDKKHFLAYPIGQYILSLHDMWDLESNKVKCTEEAIRKCLASGWAYKNEKNSEKYLGYFEKIKDYFAGCESVEDWEERMACLIKVYEDVLPIFKDETSDTRWVKILGNPLLNIGAFSLSKEILLELSEVLSDIFASVKILFAGGYGDKKKDVGMHFKQLRKIVKEREKQHSQEEQEVISNIILRLGMLPKEKLACSIENLIDAMHIFLGGENKDDEDRINPSAHIYSLREAEYIHYKSQGNVLACFCDDNNIPGKKEEDPWPFTEKLYANMKFSDDTTKKRIEFHLKNIASKRLYYRYLMFKTMQIPGINLSWIAEYGKKLHSPSIYINILANPAFYGLKIEKYNEILLSGKGKYKGDQSKLDISRYKVTDAPENSLAELEECRHICLYKKLYSYGLAEYPEFSDKFHLEFLASFLIVLLTRANNPIDYGTEIVEFADEVFKLLPMFNESKQKEIISFARRKYNKIAGEVYDSFEHKRYLNDRLFLKFLEMHGKKYDRESAKQKKCVYCPHSDSCYFREWVEGV